MNLSTVGFNMWLATQGCKDATTVVHFAKKNQVQDIKEHTLLNTVLHTTRYTVAGLPMGLLVRPGVLNRKLCNITLHGHMLCYVYVCGSCVVAKSLTIV
jgi:hypothetical protein